jgi:predicted  nucleic acid-binding Zn-ribbon protein
MEDLKLYLALLFELQTYDIKIIDINKQISLMPCLIEEKRKNLDNKKTELNDKKKRYVDLVSLEKDKEYLLDEKEKILSKHLVELNAVKSNDTYKALLLDIEKLKADKCNLEDELLVLMTELDAESINVKTAENELHKFEENIKQDIIDIEKNIVKLKEEIVALESKREEYKTKIDKTILSHYERLKSGRDGYAIAAIVDGKSCGGCGMVLRTQLINQALKGHDLVFCDNCSRILFKKNNTL